MSTNTALKKRYPRWPPAYPRIETVETLGEAATALRAGDHRAGLLRAVGNAFAAFLDELPPKKIGEIARGLYDAATSSKNSTRTKLRAAEAVMKILLQGTKVLADLTALAGPGKDPPTSGNTVTIDLDDPSAIEQLRHVLGVMEGMQNIEPAEVRHGR